MSPFESVLVRISLTEMNTGVCAYAGSFGSDRCRFKYLMSICIFFHHSSLTDMDACTDTFWSDGYGCRHGYGYDALSDTSLNNGLVVRRAAGLDA